MLYDLAVALIARLVWEAAKGMTRTEELMSEWCSFFRATLFRAYHDRPKDSGRAFDMETEDNKILEAKMRCLIEEFERAANESRDLPSPPKTTGLSMAQKVDVVYDAVQTTKKMRESTKERGLPPFEEQVAYVYQFLKSRESKNGQPAQKGSA